ncbi:MAG: DUF4129 domain-containing protein, partial [Methyloprofundus sp.]|nr:DUF4129 domain-containing protein [Methyloprofundus sp.]
SKTGLAKWLQNARFIWSSIDYNWQHWVVYYNNNSRAGILSELGIDDIKKLALWLSIIIISIMVLLAWFILPRKSRNIDKIAQLYDQFCKKLYKTEINKKTGEGPLDFAERVKSTHPNLDDEIDQITHLYIKLRYRNNASKNDFTLLKQKVAQFKITA